MEKDSEAENNEYPQEFKELGAAALLLVSLKYKILDKKTASTLLTSKNRILKERVIKHNNKLDAVQNIPTPRVLMCLPIDDYIPPAEPPVASLSGLIGICSKPFEKQLTLSDVRDDQSRLSINRCHVISSLLPLFNDNEQHYGDEGIPVTTYDLDGNEYPMKFKMWSAKLFVLTSGWKRFCNDHCLRKHQDFVTIWMFRHVETENLCFVITWRRLPVFEQIRGRRGGKKQLNKGSN